MHGQRLRPVSLRLCKMAQMPCKDTTPLFTGCISAGCRCANDWAKHDGELPTAKAVLLFVCLAAGLVLAWRLV